MSELKPNPNMMHYEYWRAVPQNAQKAIGAGRLKGKTDINPMWRIKVLTEVYGECGHGWYTDQVQYWSVKREDTGETAVFCSLNLYTKNGDGWSTPIYGIGGNTVIAMERNGLYLDDEAYKKAYTDALSVACKALGIGADIYWATDNTKYTQGANPPAPTTTQEPPDICEDCGNVIEGRQVSCKGVTTNYTPRDIVFKAIDKYGKPLCFDCMTKRKAQ